MIRKPALLLTLLIPLLAWSGAALAQSCSNGRTIYLRVVNMAPACGDSNCHKSNVSGNDIANGSGNPGNIDNALNTVPEMAAVRSNLGLVPTDLDDLATWIFFGSQGQPCPAAAPSLSASPPSVSFGSVNVGANSTQSVTVTNTGSGNATGMTYSTLSGEFSLVSKTCVATLAAGANCNITFRYSPTNGGTDNATYTITGGGGLSIGLTGTGAAAATPANLQVSPTAASLGSVTVGSQGANNPFTLSNTGGTQATGIGFANSNSTEFVLSGSTCGTTLNAGANCSFNLRYAPTAAGADNATLTISYAGGTAVALPMSGTGVTGGGTSGTLSTAGTISMADQTVGTASAARTVTVSNAGPGSVTVSSVSSSNSGEFPIGSNGCSTVAAGANCSFTFTFNPGVVGTRTTTLSIANNGTVGTVVVNVSGVGTSGTPPPPPPPSGTVELIEYFHAAFGHYFVTYLAGEIEKLDNGTFAGWARTGQKFKAYTSAASTTTPVCRFFTTAFPPKSSHFYTPNAPECTVVKSSSVWGFEGEVFHTQNPSVAGACPANTVPVYRMYNNGQSGAPNHRYTIDLNIRGQMLMQGWVPEGAGAIGVIMCAPP